MIVVPASALKEAQALAAASPVPIPPEVSVAIHMCHFWFAVSQPVTVHEDGEAEFFVRQLPPAGELACETAFDVIQTYLQPKAKA